MPAGGELSRNGRSNERNPAASGRSLPRMRVLVYTDYTYTRTGGAVYADRAFALFLAGLAEHVDTLVIAGRLRPDGERARYPLPEGFGFIPLPYYETLARPLDVAAATVRSARRFWRALDRVDACWLLGPHPLAIAFAALAIVRRRRVVLGVRQDMVEYVRSRHPGRRFLALAARALEGTFRLLAHRYPVVVVGPALRQRYRTSRTVLEIAVSLIEGGDVVDPREAMSRPYHDPLTLLAVGRIEEEKNPLMLADVLASLSELDPGTWKLTVCGEGNLLGALEGRLAELGQADRADLRGYVAHEQMLSVYRSSHVLVHVSWTEGLPQVMIEALAAGLPVVATDVGGIGEALGDAVLLTPPGDVDAAVAAVRRVCEDDRLRERLVRAGFDYARRHTLEAETARVAVLLNGEGAT